MSNGKKGKLYIIFCFLFIFRFFLFSFIVNSSLCSFGWFTHTFSRAESVQVAKSKRKSFAVFFVFLSSEKCTICCRLQWKIKDFFVTAMKWYRTIPTIFTAMNKCLFLLLFLFVFSCTRERIPYSFFCAACSQLLSKWEILNINSSFNNNCSVFFSFIYRVNKLKRWILNMYQCCFCSTMLLFHDFNSFSFIFPFHFNNSC